MEAPSLNWPRVNDGSVAYENACTTVLGQQLRQDLDFERGQGRYRYVTERPQDPLYVSAIKRGELLAEDTTGF